MTTSSLEQGKCITQNNEPFHRWPSLLCSGLEKGLFRGHWCSSIFYAPALAFHHLHAVRQSLIILQFVFLLLIYQPLGLDVCHKGLW